MDTSKIDILNNIISSDEIKLYEKSELEVALKKNKKFMLYSKNFRKTQRST